MYTRREESTKETLEEPEVTFEAVGDLGDQVDEEKPSKIPSTHHTQRLENFKLNLIIFYFSVAEKQPARQSETNSVAKIEEEIQKRMLKSAEVL